MNTFQLEFQQKTQEVNNASPSDFQVIQDFERELSEKDVFHLALKTGAKIPDFTLPNAKGEKIAIQDLYQKQPLVLVFYRGQWCPFCNLYLRTLQKSLSEIKENPATLVAISPQTPEHSLDTVQELELGFEVLSDVGGVVGKQFNLIYVLPDYLTDTYKNFGIDVEQFNGKGNLQLPYPATYIINRKGVIVQHFINANLNQRQDPQEVIDFLSKM